MFAEVIHRLFEADERVGRLLGAAVRPRWAAFVRVVYAGYKWLAGSTSAPTWRVVWGGRAIRSWVVAMSRGSSRRSPAEHESEPRRPRVRRGAKT